MKTPWLQEDWRAAKPMAIMEKLDQIPLRGLGMTITSPALPLQADAEGVIRVGGTRVSLDTLAAAFRDGSTAEGVAERFPSLALADIYAAFAYLLSQPEEAEAYLARRRGEAAMVRAENEARFPPDGVRARLTARRRGA